MKAPGNGLVPQPVKFKEAKKDATHTQVRSADLFCNYCDQNKKDFFRRLRKKIGGYGSLFQPLNQARARGTLRHISSP